MGLLKKVFVVVTVLLNCLAVKAVRFDSDSEIPRTSAKTKALLEQRLFEIIPLQKMNRAGISLALERARGTQESSLSRILVLEKALDLQFEEFIQKFGEGQRESLVTHWRDSRWVTFSERAEHTIISRPLGEAHFFGMMNFQLTLDKKLESLPLFTRLIKMIVLTHVIAPQLMVEESEGVAFSKETWAAQEFLTQTSGFWTLSLWMESIQMSQFLESEVKTSGLELKQIRGLLENLRTLRGSDPVSGLNSFISTQYPMGASEPQWREFLQKWFNESLAWSPHDARVEKKSEVNKTTVLQFRPRSALPEKTKCQIVLNTEKGDKL